METTLLTFGILLMLVGLIGQVKVKEIDVGTQNPFVRFILGVLGCVFVYFALSNGYFTDKQSTVAETDTPYSSTLSNPTSLPNNNNAEEATYSDPPPSTSGCILTISNSLVSLMSDPDTFSQQMISVPPGDYSSLDYKEIIFAGQTQGWYQIEAEGRIG